MRILCFATIFRNDDASRDGNTRVVLSEAAGCRQHPRCVKVASSAYGDAGNLVTPSFKMQTQTNVAFI